MFRLASLGAILIASSIFVAPAMAATSDSALVVSGSAPATAHGPGTVMFTYSLQAATDLEAVTISTDEDAFLPADAESVTLDGVAVSSAHVGHTGGNLDITIGTVATGAHTLTFKAHVPATPSRLTSSKVTVQYTAHGSDPVSVDSPPVVLDINEPDILAAYGPDAAPGIVQAVGTGRFADLEVMVENAGFGQPTTTLTVDLPNGLMVAPHGITGSTGAPLPCQAVSATRSTCAAGRTGHHDAHFVDILMIATTDADPGTDGTVTVTATPDEGADTDPTNNSLSAKYAFTGTAHILPTLTASHLTVAVGQTTVVTATIHNYGPQPAIFAEAFGNLNDSHFVIIAFDGNTDSIPWPFSKASPTRLRHTVRVRAHDQGIPPDSVEWLITEIKPGQAATAHITIKAVSVGTTRLDMSDVFSTAANPACESTKQGCPAVLTLTAIATQPPPTAPRTPTPTHTPDTSAVEASTQLANSGATPAPLALLGIGLILVGAAALQLGRRTRR